MSTVIKIEHLSKKYRLGSVGSSMLADDIQNWWNKLRGKKEEEIDFFDNPLKGKIHVALKDISFDVKQGEVVGIIGKNGAGKSTLLKILSKVTTPTSGSIKVKGKIASLLEVGTGFHGDLSGRENVYLNGVILGMNRKEISKKFDEIVEFSGVTKFIDTPVKRYSSGMYVRLAFAVAAHLDPDILIVDEVLAVGDTEFQRKCLGKMKDVSKNEGRTVLFVSHNMGAIKNISTRSIVLRKGEIDFIGNVEEGISLYLKANKTTDQIGTNSYEAEILQEVNVPIYVKSAMLYNSFRETSAEFDCNDSITITLTVLITKLIRGLKGYMVIRNSEEEAFIETDTYDFLPNILEELPVGEHTLKLTIPPRVLPVGKLFVYVDFASDFNIERMNFGPAKDILSFTLSDPHTMRGNRRSAHTSAILKWEKA